MNEFIHEPIANFWPAVLLALGFPLALLLLNEAIDACRKSAYPLARTLGTVRNFVAPSLALLVFVDQVLELPRANTFLRIVESAFWLFLLYALLGIVNDVVFGAVSSDSWRQRIPKLFLDLLRVLLVALGAMVIYSRVWGHEVTGALTALGLGSIVIGLALQEPLGNIVSGLMLLFERPITLGDWVVAGGVTGQVIEINWRSVHIQTATREVQVIPNVSLYKGAFTNLSRPTPLRTEWIDIGFSYDDPPNRVKEVMLSLLNATPGVQADPPPTVRTLKYGDFSVTYRLSFSVARQEDLADVRDTVLTRLWYLVRREGLTIPFPTAMSLRPGESPGATPPTAAECLREHARFKPAITDGGETPPFVIDYARGESVQSADARFRGFALILKGRAVLLATDANGHSIEIGQLGPGECFGDQVTAGGSTDNLGIIAAEDLKVMVFGDQAIGELLNQSPGLAAEIGDAIEARRQAAHAARHRR
jgi:small-conductance mechanosensitive channel